MVFNPLSAKTYLFSTTFFTKQYSTYFCPPMIGYAPHLWREEFGNFENSLALKKL